jgi:hypothetical protein
MNNYEALLEDEDNIFGGTPASKYHDITNNASNEVVRDEFDKIIERFAIMEAILTKEHGYKELEQLLNRYNLKNSSAIDEYKKSLYIEFTGNIVMRLDS